MGIACRDPMIANQRDLGPERSRMEELGDAT
jgi:hypothetical protein